MIQELKPFAEGTLTDVLPSDQPHVRPATPPPLRREIRKTALVGAGIIILFFAVGGGWAATAPLSGAVIAAGVVSPDGSRQTIQHLEGGIISEIRVREGDLVQAGDILVILENVKPQADMGAQLSQLRWLAATEARLKTERLGRGDVVFDHPSLANRDDPEVNDVTDQQRHQFETRRTNDQTRVSILEQRIAQLERQNGGAEQQLAGVRRQKELIREELAAVRDLFEKGYERKPRMLELQRIEAGLIGTEGELVARIARNQEAIGETRMHIINVRVERMEQIDQELARVQTERVQTENQVRESFDRLKRTTLVAPVTGTVLDLRFKTEGGVIRPGEAVLDIVPSDDDLIIDARISPRDIDEVHPTQKAMVMFPSYSQRMLPRIPGEVRHVSADSLEEPRTGERYFKAKISVEREDLRELAPQIELVPGLPAEVFISTTERTVLNYLLHPLMQVVTRSFREH